MQRSWGSSRQDVLEEQPDDPCGWSRVKEAGGQRERVEDREGTGQVSLQGLLAVGKALDCR